MIRVGIFIGLLIGLVVADSQACNKCGIFGRGCRYYSAPAYVAPAAVVAQPSVLVVQNAYPAPIAQQGSTVFGYQAYSAAYSVNPAEVLRQAAELSKAATATATIGLTGFNQTAQTQLALQASITEPLARGQAAAQVLTAAGLSQPFQQQAQTLALRISQQGGQYRVETLDPSQLKLEASVGASEGSAAPTPVAPLNAASSILATKCSRCHGVNLAEPKGSVFIDAGHKLDCATITKSIRLIKTDKMPKDQPLTAQEKAAVLDELLSLEATSE